MQLVTLSEQKHSRHVVHLGVHTVPLSVVTPAGHCGLLPADGAPGTAERGALPAGGGRRVAG